MFLPPPLPTFATPETKYDEHNEEKYWGDGDNHCQSYWLLHTCKYREITLKLPEYLDTQNISVIIHKFEQHGSTIRVIIQNDDDWPTV